MPFTISPTVSTLRKMFGVGDLVQGGLHRRVPVRLHQLGEDVGVEQGLHSSTSRIGLSSRVKSSSSRPTPWSRTP